jgi:hypothetical protein
LGRADETEIVKHFAFFLTDGHEDIWNDETLFEIEPSSNSNLFDYFKEHKNEFLGK